MCCRLSVPANNGFTLGIRVPDQTFNDCMQADGGWPIDTNTGPAPDTFTVNNKNPVTTPAFTYDAAGNVTWDTTNALKYDAEGRMPPTTGTTYTYDGDGRQTKRPPHNRLFSQAEIAFCTPQ